MDGLRSDRRRHWPQRRSEDAAEVDAQVVEEGVKERNDHQREKGRREETANHRPPEGSVGQPDHLGIAHGHRDQTADRGQRRHQNGAEALPPRFQERLETGHAAGPEAIGRIDQNDGVVHHHADENHDADHGHAVHGGVGQVEHPKDADEGERHGDDHGKREHDRLEEDPPSAESRRSWRA